MNYTHKKNLAIHSLVVFTLSLTLAILSIYFFDIQLAYFSKNPAQEKIYYFSREITNIGYSIHYFIAAFLGLFFAKIIYPNSNYLKNKISDFKNELIFSWSIFTVKCLVVVGIFLHVFKFIIGRQRPHNSENFYNLNFQNFSLDHNWQSMPSGHAQVLFTVATIGLLIWPNKKYWFLFFAALFSLTRVTTYQHYLSDIIIGGALGYICTIWLHFIWVTKK